MDFLGNPIYQIDQLPWKIIYITSPCHVDNHIVIGSCSLEGQQQTHTTPATSEQPTTPEAYSASSRPAATTGGRCAYHPAHSSLPHRKRRACTAHIGAPLEHTALVTRGERIAGSHRMSPTQGCFSKIGKQPTYRNRNKNSELGKMRLQRNIFQTKEYNKTSGD